MECSIYSTVCTFAWRRSRRRKDIFRNFCRVRTRAWNFPESTTCLQTRERMNSRQNRLTSFPKSQAWARYRKAVLTPHSTTFPLEILLMALYGKKQDFFFFCRESVFSVQGCRYANGLPKVYSLKGVQGSHQRTCLFYSLRSQRLVAMSETLLILLPICLKKSEKLSEMFCW